MQWQRSKNWVYLIFIMVFLLTPLFLHATDEEKIQRGIKRLNELIEKNAANDARGESYLNEYIFSLDPDPEPSHVITKGTVFVSDVASKEISDELISLAASEKIHFYIALNGSFLKVGNLDQYGNNTIPSDVSRSELEAIEQKVINSIYKDSKIGELGEGKNALLSIAPVQTIWLSSKNPEKDKLTFQYYRTIASGKAYPELPSIINEKYKSTFTNYSSNPAEALKKDKEIYVNVLRNYEEEKKSLLPGSSPPSLQFIESYKQFATDPAINAKIGEITRLIDKDQAAYLEMRELMKGDSVLKLSHPGGAYRFFNNDFTIIQDLGSTADGFEAFRQSIITYQNYKVSITSLADAITCSAKPNQTPDQFKAKVYYCAAVLTPATAASLSLQTRKNLICALSTMDLSGAYTVARNQLTTDVGKEEVILRILNNTPEGQRKELIDYLYVTPAVFDRLSSEMDLQNYQDFMLRLVDWIQVHYPSTETWLQITQRAERNRRAILPLGTFSDGYSQYFAGENGKIVIYYSITENFEDIEITDNLSLPVPSIKNHNLSSIPLTDYVVVKFDSPYEIGGKKYLAGEVYKMPALLAYLIMHNMEVNTVKTIGKYTLYAAGLLIGVGEIAAAETAVELTIAMIDMGIASADIAVNEGLAEDLNNTEEGKQWLNNWNRFVLIYSAGRVVTELTGVTNSLKSFPDKPEANLITERIAQKAEMNLVNGNWAEDAASFVKTIGKDESDVNLVKQWLNNVDDKNYVAVHGNGTEFKVLYKNNDVVLSHRSLAQWIKTNPGNKQIVLLTCADGRAAQNLVNKLGADYQVISWEGITEVYANGYIKGEGKCYRYSNSGSADFKREELLGSDIPKGSTASSPSGSKVVLGNNSSNNGGNIWKSFDVKGEFTKGLTTVSESFVNKNGVTVNLQWKRVGSKIEFGLRSEIRTTLGLVTGSGTEAHHIITWTKGGLHDVVQIAALDGFHPNMFENAIELEKYFEGIGGIHGNHPAYDAFMEFRMTSFQRITSGLTPAKANEYLQRSLIPELIEKINSAKNSSLNLNEYFKQIVNKNEGLPGY